MKRSLTLSALAVFASTTWACSFLASFDGFVGGSSDAGSTDAPAGDVVAGGDGQSAADATTGASDSATDSGGGDATSTSSFCATRSPVPTFCDDFDEESNPSDNWDTVSQNPTNIATLKLDPTQFISPPASLDMAITGGPSNTNNGRVAFLAKALTQTATSSARVEFRVRLDKIDPTSAVALAGIAFGVGGNDDYYQITIYVGASGGFIQDGLTTDGGISYPEYAWSVAPTVGTWSHVVALLDFSSRHMSVTVDGATALSQAMDPLAAPGVPAIGLGLGYYTSSFVAATSAHFDDFAVDIR